MNGAGWVVGGGLRNQAKLRSDLTWLFDVERWNKSRVEMTGALLGLTCVEGSLGNRGKVKCAGAPRGGKLAHPPIQQIGFHKALSASEIGHFSENGFHSVQKKKAEKQNYRLVSTQR